MARMSCCATSPLRLVLAACLLFPLAWRCSAGRQQPLAKDASSSSSAVFLGDVSELQKFMRRQDQKAQSASQAHVDDIEFKAQDGIDILYRGTEYQSFDRPLPEVVETTLFTEFEEYYNQTQEFHAHGSNAYKPQGRQLVVSVKGGSVTGVLGEVRNAQGHVLSQFSVQSESRVTLAQAQEPKECKRFKKLATAIQKYGHMYHHFVLEVVPRLVLLQPFLDPDTKVLLFGSVHEFKWLSRLGISADQVEVYDPNTQYCADQLLVPSLSQIITPPKENFELLRSTFQADASSLEDGHELLIYCSRRDTRERIVSNEDALLSAIKSRFPDLQLYVYTGQESVQETIRLFRMASVVVGMHGAGLSHIVFAPPGTAVVELLFMPDPPMMFWHAASALQQRYIMVPLPQSWWLERLVSINSQDVLDALALALDITPGECQLGHQLLAETGQCLSCPAGTYRPAGASACLPCAAGRHASEDGAAFCSICPAGTFSDGLGLSCSPCPGDQSTLFPGAGSMGSCISTQAVDLQLKRMFSQEALTEKLVSLPALELAKPRTAAERIAAAVSPFQWYQQYQRRQLRHQYLNELFNTDIQMRELEVDNLRRVGQASQRRELFSGYKRRHILAYH